MARIKKCHNFANKNQIIEQMKKLVAVIFVCCFYAASTQTNAGVCINQTGISAQTDDEVPLNIKKKNNNGTGAPSNPKSPIMVPEITLDGRTIHFVTPCVGLTFRLVQEDEVCYETEITSDVIEIPQNYVGAYELQILRGDYIFYADIELD